MGRSQTESLEGKLLAKRANKDERELRASGSKLGNEVCAVSRPEI